ncbi:MAG TPA: mandelate racemase/muconate lactonizing enzyme family protein [Geminicoccaceae bacterium]|nr:mandelate racemase/muconate lactonizing enzyme family protein [Geminicoccaceae bacterium]
MSLPHTAPLRVERLGVAVYRAPIERQVRNAFGAMMANRPAVIVRAEAGGIAGYGEIWCNFPTCGAEHRARLLESVFRPWVTEREWASPAEAFRELTARSYRLALQAGEPGPIAQVVAGIDIALWDLAARQAGQPLWRLLGGGQGRMPAYASGINPDRAVEQAKEAKAAGFCAFKLKIGFGAELDLANLEALRQELGPDAQIAVDANQAWGLDEAIAMSRALAEHAPLWLEEPMPADTPLDNWQRLAKASPIPLAAGENLRGDGAFDAAIASGAFGVIQPDVAKWGGISGCLPLARRILAAGLRYCPHYLGGGIGLLASAHLLAAAGGDGLLEVDSNANPLREGLAVPFPALEDGRFVLTDAPGLGVAPGPDVERFAAPVLASG